MGATKISRIPDHKFVLKLPLVSEWIVNMRNRPNCFVIRPVMDNVDAISCGSSGKNLRHHLPPHDDVGFGCFQ